MKALLSVYDKTGLIPFARGLVKLGFELVSTGGTQQALVQGGLPVRPVAELTHFPEILDGRVKTLHPAIHGAILARRDKKSHMAQLEAKAIEPIDLVVVNLYPFQSTVSRKHTLEEALENIDIGGPSMLRSASKNYPHVLPVVDPADYDRVLEMLRKGQAPLEERRRLAEKAFQHCALYDTAIAQYLRGDGLAFPEVLTLGLRRLYLLRYGENPHQGAAFYAEEGYGVERGGLVKARLLAGKELSYNNILDLDAALGVVADFSEPTVAVLKHNNPCGLASHPELAEAYRRALAGDPVSAFGGVVAANRPVDLATAQEMARTHFDAIVAPDFEATALEVLAKKKDLRLVAAELPAPGLRRAEVRQVRGGFLLQERDAIIEDPSAWKLVTARAPTEEERADLAFAWKAVKHIKSNAIALARASALVGMGAGQPNRVMSVEIALKVAGERARGSVLASDAFFPFPDGVEAAARGGVTAIVQPGGSVKDQEVIQAADRAGLAMLFTGLRHFRH